jgi:DUF3040 family protein
MALSMDEQRILAEIERRLAAHDPELAAALTGFRPYRLWMRIRDVFPARSPVAKSSSVAAAHRKSRPSSKINKPLSIGLLFISMITMGVIGAVVGWFIAGWSYMGNVSMTSPSPNFGHAAFVGAQDGLTLWVIGVPIITLEWWAARRLEAREQRLKRPGVPYWKFWFVILNVCTFGCAVFGYATAAAHFQNGRWWMFGPHGAVGLNAAKWGVMGAVLCLGMFLVAYWEYCTRERTKRSQEENRSDQ